MTPDLDQNTHFADEEVEFEVVRWFGSTKFRTCFPETALQRASCLLSFFLSHVGNTQLFPTACFLPESLLYYSHKMFHFWLSNMWRFFPQQAILCDTSWVSYSLTQSDTIYLEYVSDPTGQGLSPSGCPLPFRCQLQAQFITFCLWPTGCRLEVPMTSSSGLNN